MGSKGPGSPASPLDQGRFREFRRRKSGEYRIVEGLGSDDNLGKHEKVGQAYDEAEAPRDCAAQPITRWRRP